jgi:hypothetical protein
MAACDRAREGDGFADVLGAHIQATVRSSHAEAAWGTLPNLTQIEIPVDGLGRESRAVPGAA